MNVFWLFNFSITLTAGCWNKTRIARNHQTWDELPLTLVTFLSGHVQKQRKPASVKHNHSSRVWVRSSTSKVWWMWESCHCGAFQDCSEHTWLDVINEAVVCWTHTHTQPLLESWTLLVFKLWNLQLCLREDFDIKLSQVADRSLILILTWTLKSNVNPEKALWSRLCAHVYSADHTVRVRADTHTNSQVRSD